MTKNLILAIISAYASACFITMEFNPSKWDIVFRAFVLIMTLALFAIAEILRRDV